MWYLEGIKYFLILLICKRLRLRQCILWCSKRDLHVALWMPSRLLLLTKWGKNLGWVLLKRLLIWDNPLVCITPVVLVRYRYDEGFLSENIDFPETISWKLQLTLIKFCSWFHWFRSSEHSSLPGKHTRDSVFVDILSGLHQQMQRHALSNQVQLHMHLSAPVNSIRAGQLIISDFFFKIKLLFFWTLWS